MTTTIQRSFKPFKKYLPRWIWSPVRAIDLLQATIHIPCVAKH